MRLTSYPITPVPAPRMTRADAWKKRPAVLRYRAFRDEVRARKVSLPQSAFIAFHIPMPASWSGKKRAAHDGAPHTQRPDIDNLYKALADAIFDNDAHIHTVCVVKRWAREGRIEVAELANHYGDRAFGVMT